MAEDKKIITPLSDEQLGNIGGGVSFTNDCCIPEGQFPCMGKCCSQSTSISGTVYQEICSCCSIWSSLPDSASLKVTYIVECSLYGYGRRIKE